MAGRRSPSDSGAGFDGDHDQRRAGDLHRASVDLDRNRQLVGEAEEIGVAPVEHRVGREAEVQLGPDEGVVPELAGLDDGVARATRTRWARCPGTTSARPLPPTVRASGATCARPVATTPHAQYSRLVSLVTSTTSSLSLHRGGDVGRLEAHRVPPTLNAGGTELFEGESELAVAVGAGNGRRDRHPAHDLGIDRSRVGQPVGRNLDRLFATDTGGDRDCGAGLRVAVFGRKDHGCVIDEGVLQTLPSGQPEPGDGQQRQHRHGHPRQSPGARACEAARS